MKTKTTAPFLLCYYTVFNVEQCEGLSLPEIERPTTAPEVDEDVLCDGIVILLVSATEDSVLENRASIRQGSRNFVTVSQKEG